MTYAMDIFELSIECLFKICGWASPEKYFTFELDVMVGIIIKMICFIYSLTLFENLTYFVFMYQYGFWFHQAIFVFREHEYIFKGNSKTWVRQFILKGCSVGQSATSLVTFQYIYNEEDEDYSFFLILFYIILSLLILDVLEIIVLIFRCGKYQDDELEGFSKEFVKYRILGGIVSIIVSLSIYILFFVQIGYDNPLFQFIPPIMIIFEIISLFIARSQLLKERVKKKLIVDDKTKNKLKMKKWYCIIIGLNYGLVGTLTSMWIFLICFLRIVLHWVFRFWCGKKGWEGIKKSCLFLLGFNEIIDYEIEYQGKSSEDQLNPTQQA